MKKHLVFSVIGSPQEVANALKQVASFVELGDDKMVGKSTLDQVIAQPFDVRYRNTDGGSDKDASIGSVAGDILSKAGIGRGPGISP